MTDKVALVGAYSMSNYGDQLYPVLIASLAAQQEVSRTTAHYALLRGRLESGAPIYPLRDLPRMRPRRVMVGGGDLIRPDHLTVGLDHLEVPTHVRARNVRHRVRAEAFRRRHMLQGPGPWLPASGWGAARMVLASVGVHALPRDEATRQAVQHIDRAWVRTAVAAERLIAVGLERDRTIVAPDMAFAIAELFDVPALRARGRQLLSPLARSGPVVLLQVAAFHGWDERRLVTLLRSFEGLDVALLPLGRYAGEHLLLRRAAAQTGASYLGEFPASDVTALLAAAGAIVTTSMHAAIIGSCLGTPVVIPAIEKTASAFSACPEPPTLMQSCDTKMAGLLREVNGHEAPAPAPSNAAAVRQAFQDVWAALSA
jgi:hypothetical protein